MDETLIGYYSAPGQPEPTFDPGLSVPCPLCGMLLDGRIKTISLMSVNDDASRFFRVHKKCWDTARASDKARIETAALDIEITTPH